MFFCLLVVSYSDRVQGVAHIHEVAIHLAAVQPQLDHRPHELVGRAHEGLVGEEVDVVLGVVIQGVAQVDEELSGRIHRVLEQAHRTRLHTVKAPTRLEVVDDGVGLVGVVGGSAGLRSEDTLQRLCLGRVVAVVGTIRVIATRSRRGRSTECSNTLVRKHLEAESLVAQGGGDVLTIHRVRRLQAVQQGTLAPAVAVVLRSGGRRTESRRRNTINCTRGVNRCGGSQRSSTAEHGGRYSPSTTSSRSRCERSSDPHHTGRRRRRSSSQRAVVRAAVRVVLMTRRHSIQSSGCREESHFV